MRRHGLVYEAVNRPWRLRTILRARRVGLARRAAQDRELVEFFAALAAQTRIDRAARVWKVMPYQHPMRRPGGDR